MRCHDVRMRAPGWFTAAFWAVIAVTLYAVLLISSWWWWVLLGALGLAASYGWWTRRQTPKPRFVFATTCAVIAAAALFGAGQGVFSSISVSTESVGDNEVVCGSVVDPTPADQLRETDGKTGQPASRENPIPGSEFERVCSDRRHYRIGDATGLALIGVLLTIRAVGHGKQRRDTTTPS